MKEFRKDYFSLVWAIDHVPHDDLENKALIGLYDLKDNLENDFCARLKIALKESNYEILTQFYKLAKEYPQLLCEDEMGVLKARLGY